MRGHFLPTVFTGLEVLFPKYILPPLSYQLPVLAIKGKGPGLMVGPLEVQIFFRSRPFIVLLGHMVSPLGVEPFV